MKKLWHKFWSHWPDPTGDLEMSILYTLGFVCIAALTTVTIIACSR